MVVRPGFNLGSYQLGDAVIKNARLSSEDTKFAQLVYGATTVGTPPIPAPQ